MNATPPPTPSPASPPDPVPLEKRPSGIMAALNPAQYDNDPATLAQFKAALLSVAGGVIAADCALLNISAQRAKPMLSSEMLVASLVLGCISMVLVLLSLAELNLGKVLLGTFRRAALSACILSLIPLLIFVARNFAPATSTTTLAADLFGVTIDPALAKQMRHARTPDPGLQALLHENSLKPTLDPKTGLPILGRHTSPLGPLARRVAQPLYLKDGTLPGPREVEDGINQRLVGELLAVRADLNNLHHGFKYSTTLVEPWTAPELYEFAYFVWGDDARKDAWQGEVEEHYLPIFHDWLRGLLVRFVLNLQGDPRGAALATGDDAAWTAAFDWWFFDQYAPPPSTQYSLGVLSIPLDKTVVAPSTAALPGVIDFLDHELDQQVHPFMNAYDLLAWSEQCQLGPLSAQVILPVLDEIDQNSTNAIIERLVAQRLLEALTKATPEFRRFHELTRTMLMVGDRRRNPEHVDFVEWVLVDQATVDNWQRSDASHAMPVLLTWIVQLHTRFASFITDDPARVAEFRKMTPTEWDAAYRDWYSQVYTPQLPGASLSPQSLPYSSWMPPDETPADTVAPGFH